MWTRLSYGGKDLPYNYSKFICDAKADLNELPTSKKDSSTKKDIKRCSVGSVAAVISEQSIYVLNNANEWKLFKDNKITTSVVVDGDTVDIASLSELQDYLNI